MITNLLNNSVIYTFVHFLFCFEGKITGACDGHSLYRCDAYCGRDGVVGTAMAIGRINNAWFSRRLDPHAGSFYPSGKAQPDIDASMDVQHVTAWAVFWRPPSKRVAAKNSVR